MTVRREAMAYAARGWRVVPVHPGSKRPTLTRWTEAASAEPDTVGRWFAEQPDAGVGIVTGAATGLWVLDVDDPDALRDLEQRHEHLPATLTSVTGSGGYHLFYRWPEGAEVRNDAGRRLGPGLDVRGEGGFVVAPPSIHPNGVAYAWELSEPEEAVDAPAWLVELVCQEERRPERPARLEQARSDRPGDRWAAATSWGDILGPDGWTLHHVDRDGEAHWVRPGKDPRAGTSATTNYQGSDVLKVFTSNPPPGLVEGETYTKLGYLAATRWSGDHAAAAKFLAGQGWGNVDPDELAHWIDLGTGEVVGRMVAGTVEAVPPPVVEDDEQGDGWTVVDLGAILDGKWDPPVPTLGLRTDGVGLLYPGRVHSFSGEPGGGKTWLALHLVAQVLADEGSAGMIDYEDTPSAIVSRLLALGVDPEAIRSRFVYVKPEGGIENETVARLVALGLDLWIIDSVGEALAVEGLNPNADDEVAVWFRRLPRRLAYGGAAVGMMDHVAKDRETRGGWAIGSQRKLAAIDGAAYTVDVVTAPTRDADGQLRIKCAKDRHGTHQRGQQVAEVLVLNADDGGVSVVVRRPAPPGRPTSYMEKVSRWMEDHALDAPFTKNELTGGVGGKAPKVREAIAVLIAEGYVDLTKDGQAHVHTLAMPYRQADDPASDRHEESGEGQYGALREMAANAVQPVENPVDEADRVPASHRVPTASGTRSLPDRVPASPAYVEAGTRDAVGGPEEPSRTTEPRPAPGDDVDDLRDWL